MDINERIAAALERIANALETKNDRRKRAKPFPVIPHPSQYAGLEDALRSNLALLPPTPLTMDELLRICGVEGRTKGHRIAMATAARICGFKQSRTSKHRFYSKP